MYEGLKILLGGIVADAASRTLHWIYSDKKLKSYIKELRTKQIRT